MFSDKGPNKIRSFLFDKILLDIVFFFDTMRVYSNLCEVIRMEKKNSLLGCLDVKAFTLIELLVVVLIIGILAAIALPQYNYSVEKSRMSEAVSMLGVIGQAHQAYILATGQQADSLDELAIDVPGEDSSYGEQARKNTKYFQYATHLMHADSLNSSTIAVANRLPITSFYVLTQFDDGMICCFGYTAAGNNFCKKVSGGVSYTQRQVTGASHCYKLN